MQLYKSKINGLLSCALIAIVALGANAQSTIPQQEPQQVREDFSSEELESFVDVVRVQQENEIEMVQAIQDEGLNLDRFNEILQVQQNPQASADSIPDEEVQKFVKASERVIEIQQEMQTEVMRAIDDTGLGMQTYQEILTAYRTYPQVQKEVDQLLTR